MHKKSKSIFYGTLFWIINIKVFLLISNFSQIKQIYYFSENISSFYNNLIIYFYEFVFTIPSFTLFLSLTFAALLLVFWIIYFMTFFHRIQGAKSEHTGFWGIVSSIFVFLGFGCIACGQTLLYSIVFFFVSNGSLLLIESIGNLSIILGIIFLIFGINKNRKILKNKNICRLD